MRLKQVTSDRNGKNVMKRINLHFAIILLGAAGAASADSEAMPRPVVYASPGGAFYLRLIPSPDFDASKNEGFVYRVSAAGDELLYTTHGWYSFTVLLSADGRHLVRTGPWPRYNWPPEETPALVFYTDGVEMRRYVVADLVQDLTNLEFSVSHYSWGGHLQWTNEGWESTVQVETVEDRTIVFDIASGQIIE